MESLNIKSSIQYRDGPEIKTNSKVINENKSRAQLKLAEFQQHLEAVEKKHQFVKNRLDYMKKVYESAGPVEMEPTMFNISPRVNSSNSFLFNNQDRCHTLIEKDQVKSNYISDNNNIKTDTEKFLTVSDSISPALCSARKFNENKIANPIFINEKQIKLKKNLNQTNKLSKVSRGLERATLVAPQHSSNSNNNYSNKPDDVMNAQEIFTSPSIAKNIKKSKLILKITDTTSPISNGGNKIQKANKSAKIPTTNAGFSSNAKLEQGMIDNVRNISRTMKVNRRRKTRMRTTNLKKTASNRPAMILLEIQPMTKNKNRTISLNKISQLELVNTSIVNVTEEKKMTDLNSNEIVEIYHNTAAENMSPSVVSSKQQFKLEEITNFKAKDKQLQVGTCSEVEIEERKQNIVNPVNKIQKLDENYSCAEMKQSIHGFHDGDGTCRRNQEGLDSLCVSHRRENCQQSEMLHSWGDKKFAVRNYLQPTISSRLKRVNRCYFATRVNMENIPFNVGSSVTRSHNLGLNIQQVFSLMKHRQWRVPYSIGKMIDPMVRLTDQWTKKICNNEKKVMDSTQTLQQNVQRRNYSSYADSFKLLNTHGDSSKISMGNTQSSTLIQKKEELQIDKDNAKKYTSVTNNSSQMRLVLSRLHDQYEAMINKHHELQTKVEKTSDLSIREELAELESELVIKEEEIRAMMNLYKEIMVLKQQMKMFQQQNSLACVTPHSGGEKKQPTEIGISNVTWTSRTPGHQYFQSSDSQKPKTNNNTRKPMVTRLVGLLRQIQSLQQKLSA